MCFLDTLPSYPRTHKKRPKLKRRVGVFSLKCFKMGTGDTVADSLINRIVFDGLDP
jgi:hypothetical protein